MNTRIILITGANGGLGQAVARAFLQELPANRVWLAVNTREVHAAKLAQENPDRCFCVALTQSLAKEMARIGITVNAVCPGFVETEALAHLAGEERKAAQMRIPMRRFGRPEEVAAAVRFLAGDEASYITGAGFKVDGGIL